MTNQNRVLLAAYDQQLRTTAEMAGAARVERIGAVWIGWFPGGSILVSYRDLAGEDPWDLVRRVVEYVESVDDKAAGPDPTGHLSLSPVPTGLDPAGPVPLVLQQATSRATIEWKTRTHDHVPGLHAALIEHGFVPDAPESVMIGQAVALAVDVLLPAGVTLRRVTTAEDVGRMTAMQTQVFDKRVEADALLAQMSADSAIECWIAEADGEVVSAGRLQPVPGTDFAGIWGGATRAEWRGRGIYRALTAERARSAMRAGSTLIHSDSTEYSRPILERYGFTKVTETVPYERAV